MVDQDTESSENKCGPGTHYDEETNSCLLDEAKPIEKAEQPEEIESIEE